MILEKIREKKEIILVALGAILVIVALLGVRHFDQTHFLANTQIEGVNCSFLSVEKAVKKINRAKREEPIEFSFINGKAYVTNLEEFDIQVQVEKVKKIFEEQHSNRKAERTYELDGFISANAELVKKFLKQIPELQEKNMKSPQNACLTWDGIEFSIEKEQLGNRIDFQKAMDMAVNALKNDEEEVDYTTITAIEPEISEEDLVPKRDKLNKILNSTINFKLSNEEIVTLGPETIRNWVYQDENGEYLIDVDQGVSEFVENLAARVDEANSILLFRPTDSDEVLTLNVPEELRTKLNQKRQAILIKELLGVSEAVYITPIYNGETIQEKMANGFVEMSIERQHVWMYKNETFIVDSPCVTGNVSKGYDTPEGIFWLLNKDEGAKLEGEGYSVVVDYWMRFFQGCGLHSASAWRSKFGGDIYKTNGSHGCVNLPDEEARIIYENIEVGMPIISY